MLCRGQLRIDLKKFQPPTKFAGALILQKNYDFPTLPPTAFKFGRNKFNVM